MQFVRGQERSAGVCMCCMVRGNKDDEEGSCSFERLALTMQLAID